MIRDIKIGTHWKKNDGRIATITRVSNMGVTFTMPDNKGNLATFGGNFTYFRKNFTLFS